MILIRSNGQVERDIEHYLDAPNGDVDGYIRNLTKSIRENPRNPIWYLARAEQYLKQQGRSILAVFDAEKSVTLGLNISRPWSTLGKAFMQMEHYEAAQATLINALRIEPRDEISLQCMEEVQRNISKKGSSEKFFEVPTFDVEFTIEEEEKYMRTLAVDNPYIEVKRLSTHRFGRAVYAKQDIPPGTTILEEEPILSATADVKACQNCYSPTSQHEVVVACEHCMEEYCSEKCKKTAWEKFHPELCGKGMDELQHWSKTGQSSSAKTVLMLAKHVGIVKNSQQWKKAISEGYTGVDPFSLPQFKYLHCTVPKSTKLSFNHIASIIVKISDKFGLEYDPYFDPAWTLRLQSIIMCNAFNIRLRSDTSEYNKIGGSILALYEILSFFNHSCSPNAQMIPAPAVTPKTPVITTKAIYKGDQIFISYIDTALRTSDRQDRLQATYGFTCTCVKCTEEQVRKV